MLTVEYLVIIEKKASPPLFGLCDTPKSFRKFLQSENSILIPTVKQIRHTSSHHLFKLNVSMGQVKDKEQRFFHLEISTDSTEQISPLITLTREIKRVITNGQGQIETLWDDISLYYSQEAYPYIYKIENLMRKLITYFMLTKVGKDWVNTASPEAIKKHIDSKKKQYIDVLFQVDFIHLGDLLFKSYTSKSIEELFNLAETQEDSYEFNSEIVLEFKPRSNWDRYFSEIVDCEADYLNKRWKQLYELRCDIAHNKPFGPSKLQDVVRLVGEIEPYLSKALDQTSEVDVSVEDKEKIAESVASNLNQSYGKFIEKWKSLEARLRQAIPQSQQEIKEGNLLLSSTINKLHDDGIIDQFILEEVRELTALRNSLVHEANLEFTENDVIKGIERVESIIDLIPIAEKPASFHDECIQKIEQSLSKTFIKQSRTTYLSEEGDIALTCNVSKLYERTPPYYWFGFYRRQKQFLDKHNESYAAFGCGSADTIYLLPLGWLANYLENCSVTDTKRFYWHIQIMNKDGKFVLYQRNGNHMDLSDYLLSSHD